MIYCRFYIVNFLILKNEGGVGLDFGVGGPKNFFSGGFERKVSSVSFVKS